MDGSHILKRSEILASRRFQFPLASPSGPREAESTPSPLPLASSSSSATSSFSRVWRILQMRRLRLDGEYSCLKKNEKKKTGEKLTSQQTPAQPTVRRRPFWEIKIPSQGRFVRAFLQLRRCNLRRGICTWSFHEIAEEVSSRNPAQILVVWRHDILKHDVQISDDKEEEEEEEDSENKNVQCNVLCV